MTLNFLIGEEPAGLFSRPTTIPIIWAVACAGMVLITFRHADAALAQARDNGVRESAASPQALAAQIRELAESVG